jgi:hypothetical protein
MIKKTTCISIRIHGLVEIFPSIICRNHPKIDPTELDVLKSRRFANDHHSSPAEFSPYIAETILFLFFHQYLLPLSFVEFLSGLLAGKESPLVPFVCSRFGNHWHYIVTCDADSDSRIHIPFVDRFSVFIVAKV